MDIGRKRVVVVTGADRGLGYEFVKQYLERGEIVFAGKYKTKWQMLEKLGERYPDTLTIVPMNVRDPDDIKKAASLILGKTDKIDILINNAGIWLDHDAGTILDGKLDYGRITDQFSVNALGTICVTESLIHTILKGYDKIVANISSEAGSITNNAKTNQIGYCMSKAALNMASCCILYAIRPLGGMVLNFHPGWMQSVIGGPVVADDPYAEMPKPENVKFYTTPAESAAGIMKIIDEPERISSMRPGFVNYRGDKMEY